MESLLEEQSEESATETEELFTSVKPEMSVDTSLTNEDILTKEPITKTEELTIDVNAKVTTKEQEASETYSSLTESSLEFVTQSESKDTTAGTEEMAT